METISALIAVVQLHNVRLVECEAKTTIRSPQDAPKIDVTIERSGRVKTPPNDAGAFLVEVRLLVSVRPDKTEPAPPVVTMRVALELEYRIPKESSFTTSQLDLFAGTNGVFNAWPFCREIVQSVFTRMDLPPLTLPLLRFPDLVAGARKAPSQKRARRNS